MREFEEHFDKRKVELGSCGRPCQAVRRATAESGWRSKIMGHLRRRRYRVDRMIGRQLDSTDMSYRVF
jgi:hypothetical protein